MNMMETELPYYDESGKEIKEYSVLRVFHFIGPRRKKFYMYKWVRLREHKGKLYWTARHLNDASDGYYHLRSCAGPDRIIKGTLIVQQNE